MNNTNTLLNSVIENTAAAPAKKKTSNKRTLERLDNYKMLYQTKRSFRIHTTSLFNWLTTKMNFIDDDGVFIDFQKQKYGSITIKVSELDYKGFVFDNITLDETGYYIFYCINKVYNGYKNVLWWEHKQNISKNINFNKILYYALEDMYVNEFYPRLKNSHQKNFSACIEIAGCKVTFSNPKGSYINNLIPNEETLYKKCVIG